MATSAIHDLTHKQRQGLGASRLLLLLSVNNADKGAKPAAFDKRLAMMWAFARDVQRCVRNETEGGSGEGHAGADADAEAETFGVDLGLATVPYFHDKSAALAESGFYNGEEGADGVGETEQVFLVGYDTLIRIFNPKYYGPLDSTAQVASPEATPMQKALGPFFARAKLRVTMRADDEWGGADEQKAYLENLYKAEGLSEVGGNKDWASRIEMVEGRKAGGDIVSSTYARAAAQARDSGKLDLMVTPEVRWWIEQENLYTE
jgi:nicotinamide-nucleotide adenylyltransferase